MKNVSVIIPAFNEEENIADTIKVAKKCTRVNEIIVVNNMCTDRTEEVSKENGAKVIKCETKGKGYAMEEGIKEAQNDIIVFLDADVKYENENVVATLLKPILTHNMDFVKSSFDRITGGIVTEVTVKPLMHLLFPNIYEFSEPISGMIASKKQVLEGMELEKDYGVDIGILIDVIEQGYKVTEVNIGKIKNMSHVNKTNETMSKMSKEIISAIIKRRDRYHTKETVSSQFDDNMCKTGKMVVI